MNGNVIDGGSLWEQIQKNTFPKGDFAPLEKVTEILKNWYRGLYLPAQEETSWQQENLVHQFGVHNEKGIDLHAPDYQSGHLDWYSFDSATV
jgi:hypothetical protein